MEKIKSKDLEFVKYKDVFTKQCHYNFLCEEDTAKYTLWRTTKGLEEAKEKLKYWTSNLKENDIFWLIKELKTSKIIGFICAEELEQDVYGNIGIAIGLKFINKGYGSQSLEKLIEQILKQGGKEIHYSHFKENLASQNLALKCGFEYIRSEKRIRRHDGKEFEELFYILNIDKN